MPAYLVAICEITNPNPNLKTYSEKSAALVEKHGGRYIVRGPAKEVLKGELLHGKVVVISEFPTMDDLLAFAKGDEYVKEVAPLRDGTGTYHFAAYEST